MDAPVTLEQTADLIAGHVRLEGELFELTGLWSADPGPGDAPTGIAVRSQALFAAESAHHGWRAEQWAQRRVRSLDPDEAATQGRSAADPISAAIRALGEQDLAAMARLAVWGHVLAPALAARYSRHRDALAPAADGGLARWLGICISDLNRGSIDAVAVLTAHREPAGIDEAVESVRSALALVLGG